MVKDFHGKLLVGTIRWLLTYALTSKTREEQELDQVKRKKSGSKSDETFLF